MREPVVSLSGAGKRYGKRWAIRHVDLILYPGEILGFIGPNGAGKTTLMRLMAGLSRATEGGLLVLGHRLDGRAPRTPDGIGLVLEQPGFIPYFSGRKNLEVLARLRRVADASSIVEVLGRVGLDPTDRRPVRTYSLGMRQRLSVAQALMEKPRLLLLDEPTNGLDPAGILQLRQLLQQLAQEGTAVFLASHLLTEVERICDRALLVREGRIIREIVLRGAHPAQLRIIVSGNPDRDTLVAWAARAGLELSPLADDQGRPAFVLKTDRPTALVVKELVEQGVSLEEFAVVRRTLEDEFMVTLGVLG